METSDEEADQDEGETEDQDKAQAEPNLEEFMDWEYLKQGNLYHLRRLHHG